MNPGDYLRTVWEELMGLVTKPGTLWIVAVALTVVSLIGLLPVIAKWKLYKKAGYPGWAIFIPYYNDYAFVRIAGLPWWCFPVKLLIEYIFPSASIITKLVLNIFVSKGFGKDVLFGFGMSFIPVVFYPIIGFGRSQYRFPAYLGAPRLDTAGASRALVDRRSTSA